MEEKSLQVAEVLKILSHPKRLLLLCLIREEELSVGQLEEALKMGQSQTSQVLNELKRLGHLKVRKEGKKSFYTLKDPKISELLNTLFRLYCEED